MVDLKAVDLDWKTEDVQRGWPRGRDTGCILFRIEHGFFQTAAGGVPGQLLDVACGEARHAPKLHRQGWRIIGLEPSPAMIARARRTAADAGTPLDLACAIGEVLPFRDGTFDRVLCESALDHFANPAEGMREIARVLKPGGHAIIATVNYGGLSCRVSRLLYALGRKLRWISSDKRLFWDTPVPHEHTFEANLPTLKRFAGSWLELEEVYGVSLLWAFPGWGRLLDRLPHAIAFKLLNGLDRVARRMPTASDFLVMRWRRPLELLNEDGEREQVG